MLPDNPARAALAEEAARGVAVEPQLRLLYTAEALTAPAPAQALDLNEELETLCAALRESVLCRAGWLYFAPAAGPVPVALPRRLLQAAVLCWIEGTLTAPERRAVLHLETAAGAAVLVLRGGIGRSLPADARALLLRTAAISGGAVVQSGGSGPFTAALRLPLRTDLPLRVAEEPETLLWDRYSPLQLFLPGFCAGANE